MIKTKKKSIHVPLVVSGYVLFSLLIIATLLSTTIPFGILLFNPRVLHHNVAVITIALTVGSFLPVLIGYVIGDRSTKSKNRLSHHFNGVLFGLLAFQVLTSPLLMVIPADLFAGDFNMRIIVFNVLPSVGVAIVTSILAIAHVRSRQAKHDILEYKPFPVLLIASMIVMPLWSLVNNIITNSVSVNSFMSLVIIIFLGLISYVSLRKTQLSKFNKVAWSSVSVSMVFVVTYASPQLVYAIATYLNARPTMEDQAIVSGIGVVLALVGWLVYWVIQVKTLRLNVAKSAPSLVK